MTAITIPVVAPERASCLSLAHSNQPSFGVPVKEFLVFGLLSITSTTSFAGQKFDPLTGKIDCNGDLDCFRKQQEDKNPLSIFNRPSQKPAPTQVIKIQDAGHSHLGTIEGLIELDLKNHHLSPTELNNIKGSFKGFLAGIEAPEHLAGMYEKFHTETNKNIDQMNQTQLIASMISFGEISKSLGQDGLHSGASYYLSELAPELSGFLVKVEGFESPKSPMASIKINSAGVAKAFQNMERGNFLESHSSGVMMGGKRGDDGQWTAEDRAHAAVTQAYTRGWQAGGAVGTVGLAVGSAVPGVGTFAVGATGAVLGASAGALWGSIEGYYHPELGGTKPTGVTEKTDIKTESKTETKVDPKTNKETTVTIVVKTTTVTIKDEKTGKEKTETTVVENKTEKETCGGKKCTDEPAKEKVGNKCEDPFDMEYRSVPLTPEQREEEAKRQKELADTIKGRLILLIEPRYSDPVDNTKALEWLKEKRDSTTNPGFDSDKSSSLLSKPTEQFDPLFDPQRDALSKLKVVK